MKGQLKHAKTTHAQTNLLARESGIESCLVSGLITISDFLNFDRFLQKITRCVTNVMDSTPQVTRKPMRVRGSSVRKPQGVSGDFQRSEIEILKFDIKDKDLQLAQLNRQCDKLDAVSQSIWKLIMDLEEATSEQFLSDDQRTEIPEPHELVTILRHGITKLLEIHEDLPNRFEQDFSKKAEEMMTELEEKQQLIANTIARREEYLRELKISERMAHISRTEKESLVKISEDLAQQKKATEVQAREENAIFKEKMQTLRDSLTTLRASIQAKKEESMKIKEPPDTPDVRLIDMIKEDAEMNRQATELQNRVEREIRERTVTEEEVEFTKSEIVRAKAMVEKYKAALTKEKKGRADEINENLRRQIARQREEFEWAIKSQNKRNTQLEKQRKDLLEGEEVIASFLQSLEKRLQAQMFKLPSLAQVQRKGPLPPQRSSIGKPLRLPDDPEMRMIKKAIRRIKGTRLVSKSVIMESKLRPT